MVTTLESYRQAMAQVILEQKRHHGKLSDPKYWTPPKKQDSPQPVKVQTAEKEDKIAPKKPSKTFQLFIAHLQPKKKPPLRVQLLRKIYKRRKKLQSSEMKVPRLRPSRVWEMT